MPRTAKPPGERSKTLRLAVNPTVRKYLESLRATGLYGNDHAQAAMKLVTAGIERAIETRVISKIEPKDAD
jgi:hypothetical protein